MNASTIRWVVLGVVIGVAAFLAACSTNDDPVTPAQVTAVTSEVLAMPLPEVNKTPFQRSVVAEIAEREGKGMPVPANVSFTYESSADEQLLPGQAPTIRPGEEIVITATTRISYDNPSQAGLDRWPAVLVEGEVPEDATGFVTAGDYTQQIKDQVAEEIPGVWEQHTFGYEPRTYVFTETFTVTYPELPAEAASPSASASTEVEEMVMGLTVPGPNVHYGVGFSLEIFWIPVIEFSAGFDFGWGFGIRLPMQGACSSVEPMDEGSTYYPSGTMQGVDWSAAQFTAAGAPAESGNEFVLRFGFGFHVYLGVFGATIVNLNWGLNVDNSTSFATPFGPGQNFPISPLYLPLWRFGIGPASGGIGFQLTPRVGSEKFTANWSASGEATGSGTLTYTSPGAPVEFGAVHAIDGPGLANLEVSDCRYYFNRFLIDLGLFFQLSVGRVWNGKFTIPITSINLSGITGHLWVGHHSGTCASMTPSFTIRNVPPTATIDDDGSIVASGVPTFLARSGQLIYFKGRATDPGRDDLTLTWDFGDGTPAPDILTHYPVPYDVTETQSRRFEGPCLFDVAFAATDDDGDVGMDHMAVVVTGARDQVRPLGFWQHQLAGNGHVLFDDGMLDCILGIVSHMSNVFSELRDASTAAAAHDIMFMKQNHGSAREKLDRELLAVWLNFAMGACPYTGWVDADGDGSGDTAFPEVVYTAETIRMNPGATDADLLLQRDRLHQINNGGMVRIAGYQARN